MNSFRIVSTVLFLLSVVCTAIYFVEYKIASEARRGEIYVHASQRTITSLGLIPVSIRQWTAYENRHLSQRSFLFDKFQLTNLKMLSRLETPRERFKFILQPFAVHVEPPDSLRAEKIKWSMIVAIKSAYKRVSERRALRESWGAIQFLNGVRIEVIYVIAKPDTNESQSTLKAENEKFGDLLQVDMNETYRGIGLKALAAMQWVGEMLPENWIYFSGDDDIFPDFEVLFTNIQEIMDDMKNSMALEKSLPIHCAFSYSPKPPVHRGGTKWTITREQYPYPIYPPICLGGFYGLTVKLAKSIYNASRHYPYFNLDDVFITGFMRLKVCDTYQPTEFYFNRTDENCAISTKRNSKFKHIHLRPEVYVNLWEQEEKMLTEEGAKIIKHSRILNKDFGNS